MRKKRAINRPAFLLSQSFINDAVKKDVCPKFLQYKYVDFLETDDEEKKNAMFKGRYFEWHLLGATRDGIEPKFEPLKTGRATSGGGKDFRPMAQVELDELIPYARNVLATIGLDTSEGEKQLTLKGDNMVSHIDWRTKDIMQADRKALYDIKYTETLVDDRWNGWANFETKEESKVQAVHYIVHNYMVTGEYLPFYFIIFGKSKWVRIIKIELTQDGVNQHEARMQYCQGAANAWIQEGWQAKPEFNKCVGCGYYEICPHKATKPEIETFQI